MEENIRKDGKMNFGKRGMLKRRIPAVLLILAMLLTAGCAKGGDGTKGTTGADNAANRKQEEVQQPAKVTYPVTLTDQTGREVVIEKQPETIVSGYYISTSLLLALGQKDKLTGVEKKAESRPIYGLCASEILSLPDVGTAKEFDLEQCAALHPDLVVLPAKLKNVIPSLEELGLTVLIVTPENQKLLEESVTLLGTAVNAMDRAQEMLTFVDTKMTELKKAIKDVSQPKVYITSNSAFLATAGKNMYQHDMIVNAGGKNVAEELDDDYWEQISYEQLLAWNPQYIILAADADITVESVLADPQLAECEAVKNKNVYQIPNGIESWDSPVPGCVLGNLWLASVLHPEQYPQEEYEQAVTEFYETFYGFTPEVS